MHHIEKYSNAPTSDDLVDAISEIVAEKDYFSLLLEQEYTEYSIGSFRTGALKHVDTARYRALSEANAIVPGDKKLEVFVSKLSYKIISCPKDAFNSFSGWEPVQREQFIDLYSSSGVYLENTRDEKLVCELNFLNPTQASCNVLWRRFCSSDEKPYTGNDFHAKHTEYSRFAIVSWQARGPEITISTVGLMPFTSLPEARKYATDCARDVQNGASLFRDETCWEGQEGLNQGEVQRLPEKHRAGIQ